MTAVPIARYLEEFGRMEPPTLPEAPADEAPQAPPEPQPEFGELLQQAHARGVEEGRCAARAECEAAMLEQHKAFEARMVVERSKWAGREGEKLAELLRSAVRKLQEDVAGSVARILQPFIIASLREEMTASLREALAALLSDESCPAVKISGPQDLLAELTRGLAPDLKGIECAPSDAIDVTMVARNLVVESRLQAWIDRFRAASAVE